MIIHLEHLDGEVHRPVTVSDADASKPQNISFEARVEPRVL